MEHNYNTLKMVDLKAFVREHGLQGYSRMKKVELITFLRENLRAPEPAENLRTPEPVEQM